MDKIMQKVINEYRRVLTPEQAAELSSKTRAGDRDAYEKLYYSNLRLVKLFARPLYHIGEREDIEQDGHEGLCEAVKRFDPEKGYFSVYAKYWIRATIFKNAMNNKLIRISQNKLAKLWRINMVCTELFMEYEREPKSGEIAERMRKDQKYDNLTADKIDKLQSEFGVYKVTSLNEKINSDSDAEIGDFISDDTKDTLEELVTEDEKSSLLKKIKLLSPREQEVIDYIYTDGMTKSEVSKTYGINKDRVAEIEKKALNKLRMMLIRERNHRLPM